MEFIVKTTINASAATIYKAWLSSEGHSAMTGGAASATDKVDDSFTAWDGYIWGTNLELMPNLRILQSWRTSDFTDDEPDSLLEILFDETDGKTEITLIHSNLPDHGEQYVQGWEEHYFQPMKAYF